MNITKSIITQKGELLQYYRSRAKEVIAELNQIYGEQKANLKASKLNAQLKKSKNTLLITLIQVSNSENWTNQEKLEATLIITYTNYVIMLETRNSIRPYEYMDFSRRIGELWEPFCKLCFDYPLKPLSLFIPPLFSTVKTELSSEIVTYINSLNLTEEQEAQLLKYYNKVWDMVTSGEIKLELDLHFTQKNIKYVVDFKSGFGSNEKGNTNRLLLVATIYKNLEQGYQPIILVRSPTNNHYFDVLKNSNVWEAYSGTSTYQQIKKFTGYDIKSWIDTYIDWENDFDKVTATYFQNNDLTQYLVW